MKSVASKKVQCTMVRDTDRAWSCTVAVDATPAMIHEVRLSWMDHDFWCGGRLSPGDMAETIVKYLLTADVALPGAFDAARARRWCPAIDADLRTHG